MTNLIDVAIISISLLSQTNQFESKIQCHCCDKMYVNTNQHIITTAKMTLQIKLDNGWTLMTNIYKEAKSEMIIVVGPSVTNRFNTKVNK